MPGESDRQKAAERGSWPRRHVGHTSIEKVKAAGPRSQRSSRFGAEVLTRQKQSPERSFTQSVRPPSQREKPNAMAAHRLPDRRMLWTQLGCVDDCGDEIMLHGIRLEDLCVSEEE